MHDPRTDAAPEDEHRDDTDEEIGPLEGLMDPENGVGSPAGEADVPAPPG